MKNLLLLATLFISFICIGQGYNGDTKDKKPSFYYMGIANYDLDTHSDNVGLSAAINYYCIYAEANTNAIFNNDNKTDIVNFNLGYTFFFLENNLAVIPTVGISCIDRFGHNDERFNTGFVVQAKIYKPLHIYTGVGKFDGIKLGLALKL